MSKPIRIAQVIGKAVNGGTESLWINYYQHINREAIQFDFLVESESKLISREYIEKKGGKVVIIPSYKNPFKYMSSLKKIFKDNKYDIVHSNMNSLSVFTLMAAKKAGIKIRIAHSHSSSNKKEFLKNIIKNILKPFSKKYATHFFACSKDAAIWLFGKKAYETNKITIINNALDLNRFYFDIAKRKEFRKKYNIDDKFVVGNIGRLMPQKNQSFLIDIYNSFLKNCEDSMLLLVGDGPLKENILKKINSYGIGGKVLLLSAIKNIEDLYQAMDCFVFPSIYEGLGMTLVEAQVSGLEYIASDKIPNEAFITNNGIKLPLDKKEMWINELNNVYMKWKSNTIDPRNEMKELFADSCYDINNETIKLENIYLRLMEEVK